MLRLAPLVPVALLVGSAALLLPDGGAEAGQAPGVEPLSPFATAKTEALLEDRLPCLGCHTIDGAGGRIGPDLSEVGARLPAARIEAMIQDPQGTRPAAVMPRVPMPEAWRELLVRYLAHRTGGGPPAGPGGDGGAPATGGEGAAAAEAADRSDGPALYARWCAACHGATGRGDGPNASLLPTPPTAHADAEAMSRRPDDSLFDAVWAGGYVMDRSPAMPPFGETLSRAQIRALVAHIRTLCDCRPPAWSTDGVGGR